MTIETKEQSGGLQAAADKFGTNPDCPFWATATCWLCQLSTFTLAQRPFLRLQRPTFSNPKMHQATSEANQECEWKQGQRVVFRYISDADEESRRNALCQSMLRYDSPKTGPPLLAVNGLATKKTGRVSLDTGGPSHGTNTGS